MTKTCPVCTFENSESTYSCDMCGTGLTSQEEGSDVFSMLKMLTEMYHDREVSPTQVETWRDELEIGSMVDAYVPVLSRWHIGQVSEIIPANEIKNKQIEVYLMEFDNTSNLKLDISSEYLAPPNTKSKPLEVYEQESLQSLIENRSNPMSILQPLLGKMMEEHVIEETPRIEEFTDEEIKWRKGLKVGDLLDAVDQQQIWYLAEIKKIEESDNKTKNDIDGRIYIKFVEWSDRWNTWYPRTSNNIALPYTKCTSRNDITSIINQENIMAEIIKPPDYNDVDTKHESTSIQFINYVPDTVHKERYGRFIRCSMPKDNSCMFHAIRFLCENQGERTKIHMLKNRKRCVEYVETHKDYYNEGYLGEQTVKEYGEGVKSLSYWGGAIELSIFSEIFQVQIVSIDITVPKMYKFPSDDHKFKHRVFMLYQGNHYDALAFYSDKKKRLQEFFSTDDRLSLQMAKEHAELLHMFYYKKHADDQVDWKSKDILPSTIPMIRQQSEPFHNVPEGMLVRADSAPAKKKDRDNDTTTKVAITKDIITVE